MQMLEYLYEGLAIAVICFKGQNFSLFAIFKAFVTIAISGKKET